MGKPVAAVRPSIRQVPARFRDPGRISRFSSHWHGWCLATPRLCVVDGMTRVPEQSRMSPKSLRTCKGRWLANATVKVFYGGVGDGLNPVIDGLRHTDRVSTPQGDLNLLDIILSAVVPVFFVMALGYLAGWLRDIDNHQVAELNALVMDFAL